jgi:uncharacterized damage-inducible protein DinB
MTLRSERMLARYTLWANEMIYTVVADLPEATIVAPQDTTFGSVLRTLGHSYAVGAIFQAHLERRAHGFTVRNVPVETTFDELRTLQRNLDAWYVTWIDSMSDSEMDTPIRFRFLDGSEGVMTQREMFLHVVNHHTFHRGFAVDTLRRMAVTVPATDLTVYICNDARE